MTMTSDVNNIQLGSCDVTFNSNLLGLTKGGVDVTIATTTYMVTVDQFGGTEVNEYITGRTVVVKCPFTETSLDRMQVFLPGTTLVTDKTTATKMKVNGTTGIGLALRSVAATLILDPRNTTSANYNFTVPTASPKGDVAFSYKYDAERVYTIEFNGYPDLTTGLLFVIGDSTASAV